MHNICKVCNCADAKRWYAANRKSKRVKMTPQQGKELQQRTKLRLRYKVTAAQYAFMLEKQDGVCAICGDVNPLSKRGRYRALGVDHCHFTGQVRGLLCSKCNWAISAAERDANWFKKVSRYLRGKSWITSCS